MNNSHDGNSINSYNKTNSYYNKEEVDYDEGVEEEVENSKELDNLNPDEKDNIENSLNEDFEVEEINNKNFEFNNHKNKLSYISNNTNNQEETATYKKFELKNHRNNNNNNNFHQSNEDFNKFSLKFTRDDFISSSVTKYTKEDDGTSKNSKASNASLIRELEDKWGIIEKEKNVKSRKESAMGFDKNKKFIKDSKKSIPAIANHSISLDYINISKKYYQKTIKNRNVNNNDDFEIFIKAKTQELEKFKNSNKKKYSYFSFAENIEKIKKENISDSNSNRNYLLNKVENLIFHENKETSNRQITGGNKQISSIVYDTNTRLKSRFTNKKGDFKSDDNPIPSFLNSNSDLNKNYKKLNLFRGNTFSFNNSTSNDNIDNLVYESGSERRGVNIRTGINPSKNLISKIQNIYEIVTSTTNNTLNNISETIKNNNDSFSNQTGQSNFNILDKTYTMNNLQKNFEDIFSKHNPGFKKVNLNLTNYQMNNYKISQVEEKINYHRKDSIENQIKNLYNNNCKTEISKDKIIQKIGENTQFLKNMFSKTTGNKIKNNSSIFYKNNKNLQKNEKVYAKNNFDDLLNKISQVNSVKVKKILNMNSENTNIV